MNNSILPKSAGSDRAYLGEPKSEGGIQQAQLLDESTSIQIEKGEIGSASFHTNNSNNGSHKLQEKGELSVAKDLTVVGTVDATAAQQSRQHVSPRQHAAMMSTQNTSTGGHAVKQMDHLPPHIHDQSGVALTVPNQLLPLQSSDGSPNPGPECHNAPSPYRDKRRGQNPHSPTPLGPLPNQPAVLPEVSETSASIPHSIPQPVTIHGTALKTASVPLSSQVLAPAATTNSPVPPSAPLSSVPEPPSLQKPAKFSRLRNKLQSNGSSRNDSIDRNAASEVSALPGGGYGGDLILINPGTTRESPTVINILDSCGAATKRSFSRWNIANKAICASPNGSLTAPIDDNSQPISGPQNSVIIIPPSPACVASSGTVSGEASCSVPILPAECNHPTTTPADNSQIINNSKNPEVIIIPSSPPPAKSATGKQSSGSSRSVPKHSSNRNRRTYSTRKRGISDQSIQQTSTESTKRRRKTSSPMEPSPSLPDKPVPAINSEPLGNSVGEVASEVKIDRKSQGSRPASRSLGLNNATWYGTVQRTWPILQREYPGESYFSTESIISTVENNWIAVRGPPLPKNNRWKGSIVRVLQTRMIRKPNYPLLSGEKNDNKPPSFFRLPDEDILPDSVQTAPLLENNQSSELGGNQSGALEPLNRSPSKTDVTTRAIIPREYLLESTRSIRLSEVDKARLISFVGPPSENTVKGFKGFRTIRATVGVCEGDWYYETTICDYVGDGAVRLGWGLRRSDLEAPVGFDAYGFSIRDRSGEFVHRSLRTKYAVPFGKNDVIGCRIHLPALTDKEKKAVKDSERDALEFRFSKSSQHTVPADSQVEILPRAKIAFYKNGTFLGIPAFFSESDANIVDGPSSSREDFSRQTSTGDKGNKGNAYRNRLEEAKKREMKAGVYYPAISLYENAIVQANFGPNFKFSLPEGSKPMSDAGPNTTGMNFATKNKSSKRGTQTKVEFPEGGSASGDEGGDGQQDSRNDSDDASISTPSPPKPTSVVPDQ